MAVPRIVTVEFYRLNIPEPEKVPRLYTSKPSPRLRMVSSQSPLQQVNKEARELSLKQRPFLEASRREEGLPGPAGRPVFINPEIDTLHMRQDPQTLRRSGNVVQEDVDNALQLLHFTHGQWPNMPNFPLLAITLGGLDLNRPTQIVQEVNRATALYRLGVSKLMLLVPNAHNLLRIQDFQDILYFQTIDGPTQNAAILPKDWYKNIAKSGSWYDINNPSNMTMMEILGYSHVMATMKLPELIYADVVTAKPGDRSDEMSLSLI